MRLCDGTRAWPDVLESLSRSWSAEIIGEFMFGLAHEGVLVEAGELWAHWSEVAQVPQPTAIVASDDEIATLPLHSEQRLLAGEGHADATVRDGSNPIAAVLCERESSRTFADQPISHEELCSILWAAHGVAREGRAGAPRWHRTIASGGNMHSARWFVAVLRELPSQHDAAASIRPGVYEARFHIEGGTSLHPIQADPHGAWACLRDPRVLHFASALILPIHDIAVPARKYGNRATLFAMLEAGQSLQNAQLMTVSLGRACMLRGDTVDAEALSLVGLDAAQHHWLALPAMVLGACPTSEERRGQIDDNRLKIAQNLKLAAPGTAGNAQFAFAAGPVNGAHANLLAGSGRASDPRTALTIAEAEAWERIGWATLGSATEARAPDVPRPLDPRRIVSYGAGQYRAAGFPFHPFDTERMYLWKDAVEVATGHVHAVPAECVHALHALPESFRRTAYTGTSTSGVAAGRNLDEALMRATLELVERDAFCCAWLGGGAAAAVVPDSLPSSLREQLGKLASQGAEVTLLDVSTPWAPVIAAFVQAPGLPLAAITAAASFDVESAAAKAISEAEGRLVFAQTFPPTRDDRADPMRAIEQYYRSPRTWRRSDFFRCAPRAIALGEAGRHAARTWNDSQSRLRADGFEIFCVDITPPQASVQQGRQPLHVARAIVPGLLPIWFQRGVQPAGMQRFVHHARQRGARSPGHYVHPFT